MSRDVGNFMEVKATIRSLESREADESSPSPEPSSMNWQETFKGGRVNITGKDFAKPKGGTMRKHME